MKEILLWILAIVFVIGTLKLAALAGPLALLIWHLIPLLGLAYAAFSGSNVNQNTTVIDPSPMGK